MKINDYKSYLYNKTESTNIVNSLKYVELNIVENCTRACSFCPRSDPKKYPNLKKTMSIDTIQNLVNSLYSIGYKNSIGFVGFGEPLLDKDIFEKIESIKSKLPESDIIIQTNGDLLTEHVADKIENSGCDTVIISMYDFDISEKINNIFGKTKLNVIIKHNYDISNNYNLNIINRKDILDSKIDLYINSPCYIPFYKSIVDWNGDVLLCANDWKRHITFGNVNDTPFHKIWDSDSLNNFKTDLIKNGRVVDPCKKCNVNGTLIGEKEYEIYKNRK